MSKEMRNLLYKIGVNKNNTPILLSINNNVNYQEELSSFFEGLFESSKTKHQNYLESVNTLILDATELKKKDLVSIFDHINVSPLQKEEYKICIIENVENLSLLLANALLKTIEEPLSFAFLIFTTNNIANVLCTIKSRCNVISFKQDETVCFKHEKINHLNQEQKQALLNGFRNLNSLLAWLNQEESAEIIDFFINLVSHQKEYEFLYQQSSIFSKFEYRQIRFLINWLISYFYQKENHILKIIIENFDLNLSKNYIYFCILEFLK